MDVTRRKFLDIGLKGLVVASLPFAGFEILTPEAFAWLQEGHQKGEGPWYGYVVDTTKCIGCGMCVKACKLENNVPYEISASRTWIERYVLMKDGTVLADSPWAGRDGFPTDEPEGVKIREEDVAKALFVPKLCNHCERSVCVQVCPVGASHQTDDGVILIDRTWCIGCGYCVQSCPYGSRFIHPIYNVAEKCSFCYHRITKGMNPACVDACAFGVRKWGDLRDPNSEVSRIISTQRVTVLKGDFGTRPKCFYLGIDEMVR